MTAARREQVTIDAICQRCHGVGTLGVSGVRGFEFELPCPDCTHERTDTLPAPPNLTPALHEFLVEFQRVAVEINPAGLEVLLGIAQCLRANQLDVTGELRWVLSVREGDGETINWRSGGRT